jgi:hypothetical protein
MTNLTENQKNILTKIESEFNLLNESQKNDSNDYFALIESELNEKINLRKDKEILHEINLRELFKVRDHIESILLPICEKYGFDIEIKKGGYTKVIEKFYIKILCNNYYTYSIQGSKYNATIEGEIDFITFRMSSDNNETSIYIDSPSPIFKSEYGKEIFKTENDFINYFVKNIISVLKTKL